MLANAVSRLNNPGSAMSEPNVLYRWFEEVWNKGRETAVDELASPDVIAHGIVDDQGNELVGRDAFKAFWRQFRNAFPDVHVDVHDTLVDGEKVAVRRTVRGPQGRWHRHRSHLKTGHVHGHVHRPGQEPPDCGGVE